MVSRKRSIAKSMQRTRQRLCILVLPEQRRPRSARRSVRVCLGLSLPCWAGNYSALLTEVEGLLMEVEINLMSPGGSASSLCSTATPPPSMIGR